MMRFSQADLDPCTFLYLLRDDFENLLYCYLFQAKKPQDVTDLYRQMKEQNHHQPTPTRSLSSAANLTSLCVDISPSSSNFFEVLYIGKIKISEKKVPETFIDEALDKFKVHELEKHKSRQIGSIGKLRSENDIIARAKISKVVEEERDNENDKTIINISSSNIQQSSFQRSQSFQTSLTRPATEDNKTQNKDEASDGSIIPLNRNNDNSKSSNENINSYTSSSNNEQRNPVEMDDHNRTMVLQVDRTDLRLISPDRKVILLHKHHKEICSCLQGQINSEHFGFICKDGSNTQTYVAYIFKCESCSIAYDACAAITQAFLNAESRPRTVVTSCEHCPMVWFHKLCLEIENLSDRKTQAAILRRLEQLDDEEQQIILTKFRGAETDSVREQNEFLMMLLRAHCEMKQGRHIHDTAENRSEFLNQYLGGGTIFTKAKRSLTNSFDQLLKRKSSKDDFAASLKGLNLPINNNLNRESSPSIHDVSDRESEGMRSRSSTIGSQSDLKENHHLNINESHRKGSISPEKSVASDKGPKSPMIDIFLKVGNNPKSSTSSDDGNSILNLDSGSWRQAIFKRVVTPRKTSEENGTPMRKRTKEELKILWKKSIYQAILLIRMEKENARIKAKQEESAVKRIKLEYDEMKPNQREVMEVWEMLTNKENDRIKCDRPILLQAIRQGVPRGKRGEVWQFLAEQYCTKVPPIDTIKFPSYNVPYETLLKQLTAYQHAILIDLGRTFPNHSYFSSPLGPGQLALFNLLKAYSLLDPEVGYCQGLSFVAGVLLLHMEEAQAFFLLRHLMFRRGMRSQYLPDMISLQIKLYQLSRLLHDQLPDLYNHFDFYEVAPTLYAAPWLLTVFASQFPLGFVTRVFDLIFLEGPDVIFRVALALLTHHRDNLLHCDGFEEIMDYLKNSLANIDKPTLEKVMKQVFKTDVAKQLNEYKVEYQVLQEEMQSVQPQVEALHKLETQNKTLTEQNKNLMSQLEIAIGNVQRLEKIRVLQQSQLNKLEMHSRGQEVTIVTLGGFIETLIDEKLDIEIPDDVRRILSQIKTTERRKSEFKPQQNNLMRILQKSSPTDNENIDNSKHMVKSLSTGRINLPQNVLDQNMFRTNSLNTQAATDISTNRLQNKQSPNTSTEKISKFFSSSHNNILQQKLNAQNNSKVDIKIQDFELESVQNNNNIYKKGDILAHTNPICEHNTISPTNSIDSGVGTPSSPKFISSSLDNNHPLSNCDVNFTFNGSRELKSITNIKNMTKNLMTTK